MKEMLEVKQINNKEEWEGFVSRQSNTSLLQSWSWQEFLAKENLDPHAVFILESGKPVAAALIARMRLPAGKFYLYCPRGPIFIDGLSPEKRAQIVKILADHLHSCPSCRGAIFFRLDPGLAPEEINLHTAGLRKASREVQPRQTVVVDLKKGEQEILNSFKPKTRYNIGLAKRHGIEVEQVFSEHQLRHFYKLLKTTGQRDNFYIHTFAHYWHLWEALSPDHIKVCLARFKEQVIAGIMVVIYKDTAIYLHGASEYEHRSLMAPYLLQWQAMIEAKNLGCLSYDLWGVAPKNADHTHGWSGITRFKLGFGGEYEEYVGTYDFIYQPFWYRMFNTVRSLRSIIR